jgi:hypothetical protein
MLFSTTSDAYTGLSAVASSAFNDFWPYLVLVAGIPLAFFIIEMLIGLIRPKDTGYFMGGERMKDQELGRHIYEVQNKGKTRFDE